MRSLASRSSLGIALFVASAACWPSLHAQSASLLDLVASSPAVAAARQRIEATRSRSASAGRLADPELEGMASRADMPDDDFMMWELTLRQPLPKRGERAADRERAQAVTATAEADYALLAGEIAADVAMSLAEREGAEARIRASETQLSRLEALAQSVQARLAAGASVRIADRLAVQTRTTELQLALEQARRTAADAEAASRARLGLAPTAALPAYAAPASSEITTDDAAVLRLAAARTAEAEAMVKLARASAHPMTSVGVRLEREQTAMGNGDTIGVAFSSELPFRSRRYARAEVRAAQADRAAAHADGEAARFRIAAALSRVERADRLADLARQLGAETRTRLDAELDALVRSSGSGTMAGESSVFQVVEVLEKATATELQIIDAETAARTTRAELWRYVPASKFVNVK